MRDISEIPGGTEQVKPNQNQNQTQARPPRSPRPEHTPNSSQERENRSAPRRRPSSQSHGPNDGGTTHQQGQGSPTRSNTPQQGGRPSYRQGGTSQRNAPGSRQDRPGGGSGPSHNGGSRGPSSSSHSGGSRTPTQNRPSGAGRPSGSGRPSGNTQNRSQGGGSGQRPNQRPGGARGSGRPGSRSSSASRSQERRQAPVKEKASGPISLPPQIVIKDLAEMLETSPIEIIRTLIKHGIFASINQVIDYEKAATAARDIGFEPSPMANTTASTAGRSASEVMVTQREEAQTVVIPPVVTIMGHVDHGKTSLLDTIRQTKVAAGEAGGITQHIGAYQVDVNGKKITFLDTPGHEAFTAMRARGAQVTHIAIIVVAADDGVMPQTREAIDHAQAAKVPIIIALNKIDKPGANPDRVKQQLAEIGVVIEEYGGDIVCVPVSAKKNIGIDEMLDYILLVAEVQDVRANPTRMATGVIIEAKLERNTGVNASVLVQQGTLKMGDNIVVGSIAGKIRAMFNDRGKRIQKAPPSTPVSILGLPEVPQAGDHLEAFVDEKKARQQAQQEEERRRTEAQNHVTLDTLFMQMQEGKVKELNIVLKSDVQGSAEAIKSSLSKLNDENLKVRLIREGVGNVSENDVYLATASSAIIIAFNVKADGAAIREAQKGHVDIRYYDVIYKLIEDIQAALTGLLEPTFREVVNGHAEVLQIFKAGRNTVIAGCRITDGKVARSLQARVMRKDAKIFEGKLDSLRRGKDDVREVNTGYECGIVLDGFNDFEIGDVIEAFSQERVQPGS